MKFEPGKSGNPDGRPKGAFSKRTQLAKALEMHGDALVAKAVEMALNGDANALRLCLDRVLPKIKEEALDIYKEDIDLTNISNLPAVISDIFSSIARGAITPTQGTQLCSVVEAERKAIETLELDKRVTEIEQTLKLRQRSKP